MNTKKVRYGFRFNGISNELADIILNSNINNKMKKKEKYDGEGYVVSFWLKDGSCLNDLKAIIQDNNIEEKYYDFFISLRTELENDIIDIPYFITEMIKNFGGNIQFSYTIVGDPQ